MVIWPSYCCLLIFMCIIVDQVSSSCNDDDRYGTPTTKSCKRIKDAKFQIRGVKVVPMWEFMLLKESNEFRRAKRAVQYNITYQQSQPYQQQQLASGIYTGAVQGKVHRLNVNQISRPNLHSQQVIQTPILQPVDARSHPNQRNQKQVEPSRNTGVRLPLDPSRKIKREDIFRPATPEFGGNSGGGNYRTQGEQHGEQYGDRGGQYGDTHGGDNRGGGGQYGESRSSGQGSPYGENRGSQYGGGDGARYQNGDRQQYSDNRDGSRYQGGNQQPPPYNDNRDTRYQNNQPPPYSDNNAARSQGSSSDNNNPKYQNEGAPYSDNRDTGSRYQGNTGNQPPPYTDNKDSGTPRYQGNSGNQGGPYTDNREGSGRYQGGNNQPTDSRYSGNTQPPYTDNKDGGQRYQNNGAPPYSDNKETAPRYQGGGGGNSEVPPPYRDNKEAARYQGNGNPPPYNDNNNGRLNGESGVPYGGGASVQPFSNDNGGRQYPDNQGRQQFNTGAQNYRGAANGDQFPVGGGGGGDVGGGELTETPSSGWANKKKSKKSKRRKSKKCGRCKNVSESSSEEEKRACQLCSRKGKKDKYKSKNNDQESDERGENVEGAGGQVGESSKYSGGGSSKTDENGDPVQPVLKVRPIKTRKTGRKEDDEVPSLEDDYEDDEDLEDEEEEEEEDDKKPVKPKIEDYANRSKMAMRVPIVRGKPYVPESSAETNGTMSGNMTMIMMVEKEEPSPFKGNIREGGSPQQTKYSDKPNVKYSYPPKDTVPLQSCFHNPSGYVCCNLELNNIVEATYKEIKEAGDFNPCNLQKIANKMQRANEKMFGHPFESIVSHADFAQNINFAGDLVCKLEIDGKYMLTYGTPYHADDAVGPEGADGKHLPVRSLRV